MVKKHATQIFDFIGISSAGLCLLHCLALPILTIIPTSIFDNIWVDAFFACIAILVVFNILQSDSSKIVKAILTVSLSMVILSVILDFLLGIHSALILVGGSGLIIGHVLNFLTHSKKK